MPFNISQGQGGGLDTLSESSQKLMNDNPYTYGINPDFRSQRFGHAYDNYYPGGRFNPNESRSAWWTKPNNLHGMYYDAGRSRMGFGGADMQIDNLVNPYAMPGIGMLSHGQVMQGRAENGGAAYNPFGASLNGPVVANAGSYTPAPAPTVNNGINEGSGGNLWFDPGTGQVIWKHDSYQNWDGELVPYNAWQGGDPNIG